MSELSVYFIEAKPV